MEGHRRLKMISEADTCRKYVVPRLHEAGWSDDQIVEQKYFTDGRIVVVGKKHIRKPGKKADYLLYYEPNFAIACMVYVARVFRFPYSLIGS